MKDSIGSDISTSAGSKLGIQNPGSLSTEPSTPVAQSVAVQPTPRFDVPTKRRLVAFLDFAEPFTDVLGLLGIFIFFIRYMPIDLLHDAPATGGDMGSHYYPFYTLVKYSLPHWTVRVWNPGNLGGEPHLLHYFPFPYFVMAFLSLLLPLNMAYNWGTLVGAFGIPFSVYCCTRCCDFKFPVPILSAVFSLFFLYNESYSMWGGNTMSTLAGQFAHGYALNLMVLSIGFLCREIRHRKFPLLSSLSLAALSLSHAYAYWGAPFFLLSALLFYKHQSFQFRFFWCAIAGAASVLLTLWFLIPMIDNAPWTTAFSVEWRSGRLLQEAMSIQLLPVCIISALGSSIFLFQVGKRQSWVFCIPLWLLGFAAITLPGLAIYAHLTGLVFFMPTTDIPKIIRESFYVCTGSLLLAFVVYALSRLRATAWVSQKAGRELSFWLLPLGVNMIFYVTFPYIGLVDVRALPQVLLIVCVIGGVVTGELLKSTGRFLCYFLTIPCFLLSLWWTDANVKNFPSWLKWNYSGWQTKVLYPDLMKMSDELRGTFSDPRVVYEHNDVNQGAGTVRVFEMLPYFTGRSTLESVYLQASILAPMAFHLQAEVSKTPSCPFREYKCPRPEDLGKAYDHFQLLGVGDLILATDGIKEQAKNLSFLKDRGTFGPWQVVHIEPQPSYADVIDRPLKAIVDPDWKTKFHEWFTNYNPQEPVLLVNQFLNSTWWSRIQQQDNPDFASFQSECKPTVKVDFNTLVLETPCPGRVHMLKFAFHPAWKADTGDSLVLMSPGYLGIIPSANKVTLHFGDVRKWHVAGAISIATFLVLLIGAQRRKW